MAGGNGANGRSGYHLDTEIAFGGGSGSVRFASGHGTSVPSGPYAARVSAKYSSLPLGGAITSRR